MMKHIRCCAVCFALLLLQAAVAAEKDATEPENLMARAGWKPLRGVRVHGASMKGRARCIRVAGREMTGWNYARAAAVALEPGGKYRLSAQLLVRKVDPENAPFLKIEFVARKGADWDYDRELGRASTPPYDLRKSGWQELQMEFEAPAAAGGGWVALEKGTNNPSESVALKSVLQERTGPDGKLVPGDFYALKVRNRDKVDAAVFITVLDAWPAGSRTRAEVTLEKEIMEMALVIKTQKRTWRFTLDLERRNPADPVLREDE